MAREIYIVTPEQVELRYELAGIGSRFLAMLLDSLIQSLILAVIAGLFIAGMAASTGFNMRNISPWLLAIFSLVIFIIWSAYFLYFEAAKNGQTPGKKAVGIRVIRDTGHPVDFRSAFLRNIVRLVDCLPGMYAVGIISIFASPQYRRLGDYVAGTLVVRTGIQNAVRREPTPMAEILSATSGNAAMIIAPLPTSIPQGVLQYLHNITRDDYRAIMHFLDRSNELDQLLVKSLAAKMAEPLARKLQMDMTSIDDPLAFLKDIRGEWERRMIH